VCRNSIRLKAAGLLIPIIAISNDIIGDTYIRKYIAVFADILLNGSVVVGISQTFSAPFITVDYRQCKKLFLLNICQNYVLKTFIFYLIITRVLMLIMFLAFGCHILIIMTIIIKLIESIAYNSNFTRNH
jgi:hypothetical protein